MSFQVTLKISFFIISQQVWHLGKQDLRVICSCISRFGFVFLLMQKLATRPLLAITSFKILLALHCLIFSWHEDSCFQFFLAMGERTLIFIRAFETQDIIFTKLKRHSSESSKETIQYYLSFLFEPIAFLLNIFFGTAELFWKSTSSFGS